VVQIYAQHVEKIVKYFPDWLPFIDAFKENVERGILFNITDFEPGVKYDIMPYTDSDYHWTAFERRRQVTFFEVTCFIAAPEDLIISKLRWYASSKSAKQLEDVKFLLKEPTLDKPYIARFD
jgi:hypothetical protein